MGHGNDLNYIIFNNYINRSGNNIYINQIQIEKNVVVEIIVDNKILTLTLKDI